MKCYAILETMYIKYLIGGEVKLKPVDTDRLLGMVVFETEEAAIDMAKDFQNRTTEVTDDIILKQLPNVDDLAGRLKYYYVFELENVVMVHKVMAIDILKSKPMVK